MSSYYALRIYFMLNLLQKSTSIEFDEKSCICVKKNIDCSLKRPIKITATGFKDLVVNSEVIIDKSLLVKLIVEEESSVVSLTYPKKWGKTINLDMLKTFLEIKVDPNGKRIPLKSTWAYKFFKNGKILLENGKIEKLLNPPLISLHKDVTTKHLGQHPVVHLDLSTIHHKDISNFEEFMQMFREIISKLYEKHDYMINVYKNIIMDNSTLESDKLKAEFRSEIFLKYLTRRKLDIRETTRSLEFLSEILCAHFGRQVFLLVDGYDALIQAEFTNSFLSFEPKDSNQIYDFFVNFMTKSLETNKYMRCGVISGIFCLDFGHSHALPNHRTNYNMLSKYKNLFYGFTKTDVDQLFAHVKLPENIVREAYDWYGGYKLGVYPDITVFNPWSIVNFVHKKKIQNYWGRTDILDLVSFMQRYFRIDEYLLKLLVDDRIEIKIHQKYLTLNREDVEIIKDTLAMRRCVIYLEDGFSTPMLIYFLANGFFTLSKVPLQTSWTSPTPLKFPNKEILTRILDALKNKHLFHLGAPWIMQVEKLVIVISEFVKRCESLTYLESRVKENDVVEFEFYRTSSFYPNVVGGLLSLHLKLLLDCCVYYTDENIFDSFTISLYKEEYGAVIRIQFVEIGYGTFDRPVKYFPENSEYQNFFKSKSVKNIDYILIGLRTHNPRDGRVTSAFVATNTSHLKTTK